MDIGVPELIIILVIVLLIFGPGRIVNIARELGSSIRQFRQGMGTSAGQEMPEEEKSAESLE